MVLEGLLAEEFLPADPTFGTALLGGRVEGAEDLMTHFVLVIFEGFGAVGAVEPDSFMFTIFMINETSTG